MLDVQYIKQVGQRLQLFRPVGQKKFVFRCPYCGDSKTDKKKTRGNFYQYKGDWLFKCFKCGTTTNVPNFLKKHAPDLFDEYLLGTKFKREVQLPGMQEEKVEVKELSRDIDLPSLADLPADHVAVSYMLNRKLPSKYLHDLYFAEQFKKWSNSIVPGAFQSEKYDDSRIVIPFRKENREIFAFQGRSLNPAEKLKYLTVKIEDRQKIFGLDRLDKNRTVLVTEGPLDSLFLYNAIGSADSDLASLRDIADDVVLVWDNEPRKITIMKKVEKAIEEGCSVVIWKGENTFNDINDAIMQGFSIEEINELIRERTFTGLRAMLEYNNWKKI